MSLVEKLENIGDAIREKTGETDAMTLDQMTTKISEIETKCKHLTYSEWVEADNGVKYKMCQNCGLPIMENPNCEHLHNTEWMVAGNGVNTRMCTDCGWVDVQSHVHNLKETTEPGGTADCCYTIITTCELDGCDYEVRTPVEHNFQVESNIFGSIYTCYNCGYSYEE